MTEIKSYGRPPALVEKVMEAVMILRGNEPTWAEAKRQLGNEESVHCGFYNVFYWYSCSLADPRCPWSFAVSSANKETRFWWDI